MGAGQYARDDRPWGGSDPPIVAYVYAADRKAQRPIAHLEDFDGILQVDGYSGYSALARRRQQIRLAFCWAHVRRKFYELAESSPVATEVLRRIAMLYAIEDEVRGSSEQRRAIRYERSRVIVDDLHQYLEARLRQVSAKSKLGEAIRYALPRWDGLARFLDDGRIDLDSNTVERSIRPLAQPQERALRRLGRRKRMRWAEREERLYQRHRWRVEGVHGEAKTWHGLARAVRRGLNNVRIQAFLTAAAINLKRLAAAILAVFLASLAALGAVSSTEGQNPAR